MKTEIKLLTEELYQGVRKTLLFTCGRSKFAVGWKVKLYTKQKFFFFSRDLSILGNPQFQIHVGRFMIGALRIKAKATP